MNFNKLIELYEAGEYIKLTGEFIQLDKYNKIQFVNYCDENEYTGVLATLLTTTITTPNFSIH